MDFETHKSLLAKSKYYVVSVSNRIKNVVVSFFLLAIGSRLDFNCKTVNIGKCTVKVEVSDEKQLTPQEKLNFFFHFVPSTIHLMEKNAPTKLRLCNAKVHPYCITVTLTEGFSYFNIMFLVWRKPNGGWHGGESQPQTKKKRVACSKLRVATANSENWVKMWRVWGSCHVYWV